MSVSPSTATSSSLVVGYDDRTIRVWDADTHEHLATMEGHTGGVWCLTLYGNKLFSAGGYDGTIRVWDADTHEHLATMEGHTGSVRCLTLYGNKLFSGGDYDDRTIRVWDADTHEHLATMEGQQAVWCLTLYGNKLFSGGYMMIAPSVCGMPIPTSTWLPWKGILVVCCVSPSTATSSSLCRNSWVGLINPELPTTGSSTTAATEFALRMSSTLFRSL